jgi:predicted phosphodiesterase
VKTIRRKSSERVVVISDAHIGNGSNRLEEILSIIREADFVVFNGDIFELYIHKFNMIANGKAWELVRWMFRNQDKFVYVVGNHDEALWEEEMDLFFPLYSGIILRHGRTEYVITHGHTFDKDSRRTTRLSKFLYRLEYWCNRIFRVNWQDIIFRKKKMFHRFGMWRRNLHLPAVRENAELYVKSNGIKTLIHGHTHFPEDREVDGHRIIDQGSFVIGSSYVVLHRGKAKLVSNWT